MKIYWLSFAGREGNRGIVMTKAISKDDAIKKVTSNGLNPDGEIMIFELFSPEDDIPFDQLITPKELRAKGYRSTKEGALAIPGSYDLICQECNPRKD